MKKKPVNLKKISKDQLLQGMNLALKNARSLLKEAKLLAEHKRYSRAFALGVLSIEEAGKVVFFTMCFHKDRFKTPQKSMNKFWKLYSTHQAKTAFFEDYNGMKWKSILYVRKRKQNKEAEKQYWKVVEAWRDIVKYLKKVKVSSIAELKLKCLYVDIDEKKLDFYLACQPSLKVVKGLVLLAENHIKDAVMLRDTFRRAKTDQISEDIMALMLRDWEMRRLLKTLSQQNSKQ